MLKLIKDGIISFSTKPLKLLGGLEFLPFCILIYDMYSYIVDWNSVASGWTSIMVSIGQCSIVFVVAYV